MDILFALMIGVLLGATAREVDRERSWGEFVLYTIMGFVIVLIGVWLFPTWI